jgi:hypothetical protein
MKSKNFSKPSFTIYTGVSGKKITLRGDMFRYKTDVGLFLSSNSFDGSQNFYDFYSKIKSISALNPPFSGYPVTNYTVNTNNSITFEIPARTKAEKLDIIYANPAGYIKASQMGSFTYIQILTSNIVQNIPLPPVLAKLSTVVFTPKPVKISETVSSYNVFEVTSNVSTSINDILLNNFIKLEFIGITRNVDGTKNVKLKINSKNKNIITLYVNNKPYSTFLFIDKFDTTIHNLPRFGVYSINAIDQKRNKSNDIKFKFSGGSSVSNKTKNINSTSYPDYPDYPYPTSADYPDYPDYPYPTSADYPDYPDYPYPTSADYPDYPDYPYPTDLSDYPDYPDYPYPTDLSDYPDYPDYPYPTDLNDYPDYPDYPYPTDLSDYPDYPDYPYPTDLSDYPDYPDYPYPTDLSDYPDYPDYPYPTDLSDYPDYPDYPYPTDFSDYPDYPDYPYPTDLGDYPDYPDYPYPTDLGDYPDYPDYPY